jgi:hypothetical protein
VNMSFCYGYMLGLLEGVEMVVGANNAEYSILKVRVLASFPHTIVRSSGFACQCHPPAMWERIRERNLYLTALSVLLSSLYAC